MIKKALEYIVGMATPTVQTINNETYSDKQLYRINHNPKADSIRLNTLSSLIEYIKASKDGDLAGGAKMFVHVASPTKVLLFSYLDIDRKREFLVEVDAQVPSFPFDTYIDHESFCINLQSKFIDEHDRALLLKFAGTVESGSVAEYGDDGISQQATIRTGIAKKDKAIVPSPVLLTPYRTFTEVEQIPSHFVFRMRQGGGGIQCALFEADGGAWKNHAKGLIAEYLNEFLHDEPNITIIS